MNSLIFFYNIEVNAMSEELTREIQKLNVRVERFIAEEEKFVKRLRDSLSTFQVVNHKIRTTNMKPNDNMIKEILNIKFEAIEALSEAMAKASDAEHEKSHLLESYGALLLATENVFMKILGEHRNIKFTSD
jgi:ribosomal protein L28